MFHQWERNEWFPAGSLLNIIKKQISCLNIFYIVYAEADEWEEKRKLYQEDAILAGIEAVKAGLSINTASERYQISRSTLHAKITGKYAVGKSPGPPSILPPEQEEVLVKWIFMRSNCGQAVTKDQVLNSVRMLVNIIDISNPFSEWAMTFLLCYVVCYLKNK